MQLNARLVALTQPVIEIPAASPEGLVAYCARVSSNNQDNPDVEKLLSYCIRNKHWSIFEMVNAVVEVEAPRDITRQLLRHRSFSFQEFCIFEDTEVTTLTKCGRSKKVKIKDLYKRQQSPQYSKMSDNLVRVFDEEVNLLKPTRIKEVFKTGVKELFKLSLEDNYSILSTKDHKFLTLKGFKKLEDITENDFVATNGIPVHQDYDWLKKAKSLSIKSKSGVQGIADLANVSYHTIRKWLRIHNLSFSKKEVSSYTPIWNKNLPRELQPGFQKPRSKLTRDKIRTSSKQKNSPLYKHGQGKSWRKEVALWCAGFKLSLLIKQNWKCAVSGEQLNLYNCDLDHILPVYARPDLAFSEENLQVLSKKVHREKSLRESVKAKQTVRYKKVKTVEPFGFGETYDMEVEHKSHNYVANKIITHNSQRYSDDIKFTEREARRQDEKNRQNSIDDVPEYHTNLFNTRINSVISTIGAYYKELRAYQIAKECARVILPEGLTMSRLYINGTLRSYLHYLEVRLDVSTQYEHRLLAEEIKKALTPAFPIVMRLVNDQ